MEIHNFLPIFTFLCFAIATGETSPPPEEYWLSVLPHTPMPKAVQQLLESGNKSTFPHAGKDQAIPPPQIYRSNYHTAYVNRYTDHVLAEESDEISLPNRTIFFLYKDLHPGKIMNPLFSKSPDNPSFLPRQVANSIPFSSNKLVQILNHFSINTTSREARYIRQTLDECEMPTMNGEDKFCATSLESLVDSVVSKLGRNVLVVCNEMEPENKEQEYKILTGIKMVGDEQIICHKEVYAYAVFYCHRLTATKAFMVPLAGSDGTKAKAAVICHFDTSAWSPKHVSFKWLNVKPGGPPICHFLKSDTLVWVPN